MLLVVAGEVKLERTVADRSMILEVLRPGEWFGEMGVLDSGVRTAGASALTSVELRVVGASEFTGLLGEHPAMMSELLRVTARRLATTSRLQAELGATDALGRVCGRLVEMAERYGRRSVDGVIIRSPLSQADIGAWAGISRESVVKSLSTLRELGWVRTQGRRITLLHLDAVRERGGLAA